VRRLVHWLVLCVAALAPLTASRLSEAAIEPGAEPIPLELLVLEARGCPMCQLFRDEIAPLYRITSRARRAPLRFVDVAHTDLDAMGLAAPVQIIPTVILMRDGHEVDRLVGYTGPETFMRAMSHMLGDSH
jgi:thioredoxin-related protein